MRQAKKSASSKEEAQFVKRRLLVVSHEMTLSGAPILLAHLVGWLRAYGWEPVVVTPEDGPAVEMFRSHDVEVLIEPDLLADPTHAVLRSMILRFDLVIANTIAAFPAVQAAQLEHSPVLWYLHETLVALQLIEQIQELRPALAGADALVTPTQVAADLYRPFTDRPIHVVHHGYPDVKGAPAMPGHPFTFVTIATYERRKGQDVLLDAIHDVHPDLRWRALFQMAGRTLEKPFRDQLVAKSESVPNVQLLGPLPHQRALDLLSGADVLVCASRDETMPIVLLEAMSMGKAIICTEVGGVREWLRDGENALLVPPEDSRALAIAIARCIADRDLVRGLGAAAKQTFAEHFQLDVFGRRFVDVIEKTIARARVKGTPGDYPEWVELYETLGPADRTALRRQLNSLDKQPLVSVLLPVYNPDLALLAAAIGSVKQQIYDRWELCIADDASTDPRVRPFLKKAAAADARIRVTFREKNGHMAVCSNSALALATGGWCALLDQDDMLAEHALAKIVIEIEAHPDAGLIYSDEDKIDLNGIRSNPFFKMDWNPELFLGQNYVGHLGVYRTDLLRAVGGFREGFEGSQDYDLAFRCIEKLEADQIRHIPRVLYHWRMVSGSLAEKRDAKPYAKDAARRAIASHLQRVGIAGRAEPCPENIESHRVIYDLPDPAPRVAIVIAAKKSATQLRACLESIRRLTNYPSYEIILAAASDDFRDDGSTVITAEPSSNSSQLSNCGAAAAASADVFVFLDAALEVTEPDWLREMVSHAARPFVGAVGARLWYPDGTLQHSGFILGVGGVAGIPFQGAPRGHAGFFNRTYLQRNACAVAASCMAVRSTVFNELGGFDVENLTSNYQDVDFCLRVLERDLQVIWTPYANLVVHETEALSDHDESESASRDAAFMHERWEEQLQNDPFYSPNLSLAAPGFALAFPPRWFSGELS